LRAQHYGIEIDFLGIKKLQIPESVTQNVFERMTSERKVLADRSQYEGESQAAIIKSEVEWKEDAFPFYDLAAQQGKRYHGAIFTDDNFYYESLSTKAPHALLPQLLKMKNWPNIRVYSRNYWSDKKRFENELKGLD